jgi:3-(3-hydroxy-phenyl)propionate hydroxylase
MRTEAAEIVVVGAGMVGLSLAIDLALQGVSVVVLEKGQGPAPGSRSICQAQRTLEIWDRLGAGEAIRDRGVTWKVGRVFHRDRELFAFDLQPEAGHAMPAFVNLQQHHVEAFLHARFRALGGKVRFGHALTAAQARDDGVTATVASAEGDYRIEVGWLVSCEGVRSTVRRQLGLGFEGEVFQDKFLICDVRMADAFPAERRFWFEPPFHDGQTALLHRQADDVWRIDLQLGADADPQVETRPENARARVAAMLGHDRFEFEWISLYVFQCRTLERYVHGRVVFAGDSAHQVSPFGARGGNGGVQDADNLGWKLARVARGQAPPALLESYHTERLFAARENIAHASRATDFMSPKSRAARLLRDQTLALAGSHAFARALVNSGRLSVPAHLAASPLNTPDDADWSTGRFAPGSPAVDAPVRCGGRPDWLLKHVGGEFTVLTAPEAGETPPTRLDLAGEAVTILALGRDLEDPEGLVAARYDLRPGSTLLFRPDQHLAMRSRRFDPGAVEAGVRRALALAAAAPPPRDASPPPLDPDAFYAALVEALDQAGDEQAAALLGRLAPVLANQAGDPEALAAGLDLARRPAERP